MESDLNIGVGCIYPHPAAGFSGGAKIIVPGVCGMETTRYLHDYLKGAGKRGGSIETEFRKEIEEVADQIGLDFIVNVVLNQERKIAGLFVGDKSLAFKEGVKFATEHYKVPIVEDADIIIADTYPFDINLNFARDRGFWPIYDRKKNITKVVLAACPLGLGHHELYPTKKSLWSRIYRRLKYVRTKELRNLNSKIQSIQKLIIRKRLDFLILSSGITETELKACFPKAKLYKTWKPLMSDLRLRHKNEIIKVAIFRCAPLFTLE
jgi:nickel-dependent lactate racemase